MAETPLRLDQLIVAQQTTDTQIIGWKLLGVGALAQSASIQIYRSYVDNDGFTLLATVPAVGPFYRDTTVNLLDRWRVPYYKLTIVDLNGHTRTYGPLRVNQGLDGVAINAINATNAQLRFGGNVVLIYQRKFDISDRCSNCWDAKLRKPTMSNCPVCFNTGFEGGYYAPILTLATIVPDIKANVPGDATRQVSTVSALFSNYPVLRPKDLVYEMGTGERYRVFRIDPAEARQRMLVNQNVIMEALNTSDIEHRLEVPDPATLVPVLERPNAPSRLLISDNFSPSNIMIRSTRI